jgi:thiol-disulfide isomerase/thioredoxin
MKSFFILLIAILFNNCIIAQNNNSKILYGVVTKDSLLQAPFNKWYTENYNQYTINKNTFNALTQIDKSGYTFEVFFGTWCGDSKREVPRFLKVLDTLKIKPSQVKLIATGAADSLIKQSPTNEHVGKGIFRVPVFIIYKNGKEVNRINELPALSVEKDLLEILTDNVYVPNYSAFTTINTWLQDGTLLDENTNAKGLANKIRGAVSTENELHSLGNLLQKQGFKTAALKIHKINCNLFVDNNTALAGLAGQYIAVNEMQKAVDILEAILPKMAINVEDFKEILQLLYKAKGVK